jgi:hypothetical protein
MEMIIFSVALAILLNLPIVLRARHQRRLAEARLELARTMTEMEKLMLHGHIKLGDLCHDKIYHMMLESLYAKRYCPAWKFWNLSKIKDVKAVRDRFQDEVKKQSDIGKLLQRYAKADLKAFQNNRPAIYILFVLWVMVFSGGAVVLLSGLLMLLFGILGIVTAVNAWEKFRKTIGCFIADSFIALNMQEA